MKAYIIHHNQCLDRKDIVSDLQRKTGAEIVEACWEKDPSRGCNLSHLKVAQKAKDENPNKPYLVFEDDCDLLMDIDEILNKFQEADVTFLGLNDMGFDRQHRCPLYFGTHAMMISPKARDVILAKGPLSKLPWDWTVSHLISDYFLKVAYPQYEQKEAFAIQRKGLISTITGTPRS